MSAKLSKLVVGATTTPVAVATGLVAAIALLPLARSLAETAPTILPQSVAFGVYDPGGAFAGAPGVTVEHVYVHWLQFDERAFRADAEKAAGKNRALLVTVEPWTSSRWHGGDEAVMSRIAAGGYDGRIDAVCGAAGALDRPVQIRFAEEMEDRSGRYPWAGQPPATYIEGYRHFVDRCRTRAPKASFVWSPIGNKGFADYYPGDAYVDQVGLSVFGLEAWDRDQAGRPLVFADALRPKYATAETFGKPILVAELGVSGGDCYRAQWLAGMLSAKSGFPQLESVVYFNRKETGSWPAPYGTPDWRLTLETIERAQAVQAGTDACPSAGMLPKLTEAEATSPVAAR